MAPFPGWCEGDAVIVCHRWSAVEPIPDGVMIEECELCDHDVAVAPVSAAKIGTVGWHILCRECLGTKLLPVYDFKLIGRIKRGATVLPC